MFLPIFLFVCSLSLLGIIFSVFETSYFFLFLISSLLFYLFMILFAASRKSRFYQFSHLLFRYSRLFSPFGFYFVFFVFLHADFFFIFLSFWSMELLLFPSSLLFCAIRHNSLTPNFIVIFFLVRFVGFSSLLDFFALFPGLYYSVF